MTLGRACSMSSLPEDFLSTHILLQNFEPASRTFRLNFPCVCSSKWRHLRFLSPAKSHGLMVQLHLISLQAVAHGAAIRAMKESRAQSVIAERDFDIEADGKTARLIAKVRSVDYWVPGPLLL